MLSLTPLAAVAARRWDVARRRDVAQGGSVHPRKRASALRPPAVPAGTARGGRVFRFCFAGAPRREGVMDLGFKTFEGGGGNFCPPPPPVPLPFKGIAHNPLGSRLDYPH